MNAAEEAVGIAIEVHDAAMYLARESGVPMFEHPARGFIAALEAQDPPFTVVPLAEATRTADRPSLREAAAEVVALLTTSGKQPPPLNDYGLLSTLHYYAGPNARTAVDPDKAARVTALSKAVAALRQALEGSEADLRSGRSTEDEG